MTQAILDHMEERKTLKNSPIQQERNKYKEKHREIQKMCRKAREDWINRECQEAECLEKKNSQKFHQKVKSLAFKEKILSYSIKDINGKEIFDETEILTRWREYCEGLYNDDCPNSERNQPLDVAEIPTFSTDDIYNIIINLNNNKSSGYDEIPAEFLKILDKEELEIITKLIK